MGARNSSNKEYNRILARLPKKFIRLSTVELPDNRPPFTSTLSIPVPVRISKTNNPSATTEVIPSTLPTAKQDFVPREIPTLPPKPDNFRPISVQEAQQEQPFVRSSSFAFGSNPHMHHHHHHQRSMTGEAIVISRSTVNVTGPRHLNLSQFSSFRPSRSVVERNGKQFINEVKERVERRIVQCFDETTGQMRVFEVTDYIPSRIVRPMHRHPLQQQQQNSARSTPLLPLFRPDHPANPPPVLHGRTESVTPSSLVSFKGLENRDVLAREFDLYHSGAHPPGASNTAPPATNGHPPAQPQRQQEPQIRSGNTYSERQQPPHAPSGQPYPERQQSRPKSYTGPSDGSQQSSYQYSSSQTQPFRQRSPTVSESSGSSSESDSGSSDETPEDDNEGIDRTLRGNNTRTNIKSNQPPSRPSGSDTYAGKNSSTTIDPFARPVAADMRFRQRPGGNSNYAEPIMSNRGFQANRDTHYTPIPPAIKQPIPKDPNQYSRRQNHHRASTSSAYDG